jgi:hypothetical protein
MIPSQRFEDALTYACTVHAGQTHNREHEHQPEASEVPAYLTKSQPTRQSPSLLDKDSAEPHTSASYQFAAWPKSAFFPTRPLTTGHPDDMVEAFHITIESNCEFHCCFQATWSISGLIQVRQQRRERGMHSGQTGGGETTLVFGPRSP